MSSLIGSANTHDVPWTNTIVLWYQILITYFNIDTGKVSQIHQTERRAMQM